MACAELAQAPAASEVLRDLGTLLRIDGSVLRISKGRDHDFALRGHSPFTGRRRVGICI